MAAEMKGNPGGMEPGKPPGVATGAESPTHEMASDATMDFTPSPGKAYSDPAPTVSLPGGAPAGSTPAVDDIFRTTAFDFEDGADTKSSGPSSASHRGATIGPYVVLRELGRGGMGVVYLARHEQLGRVVAIKMILAGNQAGAEAHKRFLVEAQSIARLAHPGIVTVFDIGEHEGLPYFSLEYVPGNSLAESVADQLLEPKTVAMLVAKMAVAMQYAHDKGVLHRDLKPANVLMADAETPKITDFGLAKKIEDADEAGLTQSGAIMGTPSYMSPEQASGDPTRLGPATDQYSLGAILYQLLAGRAPFVAPRTFHVIRQVLADEPVAPRKLAPQVPADLETICLKALQKDPARRYADCRAFADDLTRYLEGRPILARPVPWHERLVRWRRRNPVVAATSASAIVAILAVLAVISWSSYSLAQKNKTLGEQNVLLEKRRRQADEARQQALDRAKLANGSLTLLIDKARDSLGPYPQLRNLRKELILAAADGLEKLPDDPADRVLNSGLQKAKAEEYLYKTFLGVGEPSKAAPHIEAALKILEARNSVQGTDATRCNLASALLAKAQARQSFERDIPLSLQSSGRAVALLEAVLATPIPKKYDEKKGSMPPLFVRQELLRSRNVHTATLWQQGQIAEALASARRNVEILDETFAVLPELKALPPEVQRANRAGMAWMHQTRAVLALRAGEIAEAQKQQQEALELARLWVKNSGNGWDPRKALAEVLGFVGDLHVALKDDAQARAAYEEAVALSRELHAQDPTSEQGRNTLNLQLLRLAGFEKLRETGAQTKLYEEAVAIAQAMAQTDAEGQTQQVALALSLAAAGTHVEARAIANKLLAGIGKPDAELLVDMARVYSQCSASAGLPEAEAPADRKRAFDCLKQASDQNYRDWRHIASHPDFAPLRQAPEYEILLTALKPKK